MKIITAESAGFCFGVKRAVDMAYREIEKKSGKVYTYGPIIHNEEVVEDLKRRGVEITEDPGCLSDATIVLRSHGTPRSVYELCQNNNLTIVDATCPFVKKIHNIVCEQNKAGRTVIIVGNSQHPEVQGIKGWSGDDTIVISDTEEFDTLKLDSNGHYSIVAQTTYNHAKFKEIIDKSKQLGYDIICFDTVCNATQERQKEAEDIAADVDVMFVIGSKKSSNTQKLFEICSRRCPNTYFIQTADDLNDVDLSSANRVGITAGASTPKHIIEEVQNSVRSEF